MPEPLDPSRTVERQLHFFLLLFLCLSLLGWLPGHGPSTSNDLHQPLFARDQHMSDLLNYQHKVDIMTGPVFGGPGPTFNYPAPAAWVFAFFLKTSHPVTVYSIAFCLASAIAVLLLWPLLRRSHISPATSAATILLVAVLGSPQWFVWDRGNLEWVTWILVVLAIACFCAHKFLGTGLLVGLSLCIKPFPILFLLLLLYKRRFKEIAAAILLAAATILLALKALGPSVRGAYTGLQFGLNDYLVHYVEALRPITETRFDHSLMGLARMIIIDQDLKRHTVPLPLTFPYPLISPTLPLWSRLDLWYRFFLLFGATAALAIAWFFRNKPILNQITAISVAVTLLPFLSAEYTLLLLYLPFGLFLVFLSKDVASGAASLPKSALLLTLYALLFVPLGTEFAFFAGCVKCLLLLALLACATAWPMPMSLFGELPPSPDSTVRKFNGQEWA